MSLYWKFCENLGRRFNEWADKGLNLDLHICEDVIQRWRIR